MKSWRAVLVKHIPLQLLQKLSYVYMHLCRRFKMLHEKPSLPHNLIIDVCNICNLHCPLCPSGAGVMHFPKKIMDTTTFQMVLDKLPFVRYISFFNWGEPLLNKDLPVIINLAAQRKICTAIHSNFSLDLSDQQVKALADSGLSKLVLSIDGGDQESYNPYRKKGDFSKVLYNLEKFQGYNVRHIPVIWKMIINRFNVNSQQKAKTLAQRFNCEFLLSYLSLADYFPDTNIVNGPIDRLIDYWLPVENKYRLKRYQKAFTLPIYDYPCNHLFETPVINPDATVSPCCHITDRRNVFGDLKENTFGEIWYGNRYRHARRLFISKKNQLEKPEKNLICTQCQVFKKP